MGRIGSPLGAAPGILGKMAAAAAPAPSKPE